MIGLDYEIEKLRLLFENSLWADKNYTAYGRAFLNKKNDKTIPEIYLANGMDYQEVLLNSDVDGHSFFIVEDTINAADGSNADYEANVNIYFAVNLAKLYTSITERAVEYVHRDVISIINNTSFEINNIITGLDSFDFSFVKEKHNMQPNYLVRFETSIIYQLNKNKYC